jgi:hypothetical protein
VVGKPLGPLSPPVLPLPGAFAGSLCRDMKSARGAERGVPPLDNARGRFRQRDAVLPGDAP